MGLIYSVLLKNTFQKKPSQPKNGATMPRSDSIDHVSSLCCVCISIMKFCTPSDQKLCTLEVKCILTANSLTKLVGWLVGK